LQAFEVAGWVPPQEELSETSPADQRIQSTPRVVISWHAAHRSHDVVSQYNSSPTYQNPSITIFTTGIHSPETGFRSSTVTSAHPKVSGCKQIASTATVMMSAASPGAQPKHPEIQAVLKSPSTVSSGLVVADESSLTT
jgi:hypothetical protein